MAISYGGVGISPAIDQAVVIVESASGCPMSRVGDATGAEVLISSGGVLVLPGGPAATTYDTGRWG